MERKSERTQKKNPEMGIKKRAKRSVPVESSDSEKTSSMQEVSPPQKKQRKEDEETSSVDVTPSKGKKKAGDQTEGEKSTAKEKSAAKKKGVKGGKKETEKEEKQSGIPTPRPGMKIKTVAQKGKSPLKEKKAGKSSISSEWFVEDVDFKTWKDSFSTLPVTKCFLMEQTLIDKLSSVEYVKALMGSELWKLVNPESASYPRLTRLFYLNMKSERVDGKQILKSRVAGVDITLDHKAFAKVLDLKEFEEKDLPAKDFSIKSAKSQFILEAHQNSKKQLTHTVLNCEAKILFNVLVRFILPKETSRELLTDRTLEIMWWIVSGYEIDVAKVVMEHMVLTGGRTRKNSMPYSNLLPLFFTHFGISLKEEEEVVSSFESFGEEALQRIGVVQSGKGRWIFYEDLTEADFTEKKYVKPRFNTKTAGTADLNQVMERLEDLEGTVLVLKEDLFDLNKALTNFRDSVDEKLDLIIKGLHLEKVISVEDSEESEESNLKDDETLKSHFEKVKKKKKEEVSKKVDVLKKKNEEDQAGSEEVAEAEEAGEEGGTSGEAADQEAEPEKKTEEKKKGKKTSEADSSNL